MAGTRNPTWARDELILALDVYLRVKPVHTSERNPEIVALSELLNALPIHDNKPSPRSFRNPNSVYMKLCNFLRLDPAYKGRGLTRGGRKEAEIWSEFANDCGRLRAIAKAIRASASEVASRDVSREVPSEDDGFLEGRILTALHRLRERNPAVACQKKHAVLRATGALKCEACEFDFRTRYGELGDGFAECHHTLALSCLPGPQRTRMADLAIVCANCHRMLHRSKPMLSIDDLRRRLR